MDPVQDEKKVLHRRVAFRNSSYNSISATYHTLFHIIVLGEMTTLNSGESISLPSRFIRYTTDVGSGDIGMVMKVYVPPHASKQFKIQSNNYPKTAYITLDST